MDYEIYFHIQVEITLFWRKSPFSGMSNYPLIIG